MNKEECAYHGFSMSAFFQFQNETFLWANEVPRLLLLVRESFGDVCLLQAQYQP